MPGPSSRMFDARRLMFDFQPKIVAALAVIRLGPSHNPLAWGEEAQRQVRVQSPKEISTSRAV
jgi:hypothetical protein